ncbi:hypothetical protein ACMU_15100 [Actibacterium mucosum KCTC 23349]|uniref:Glycosyltransferase RgtA/B/C/D-like domain-containing protein n=1 Tax=Actibacterium mucosum KCTC 23349 TaxID=1454373 RepID=A0A037ZJS3_9RHOB|nr:glycosyltransferase family 39 protein [Actibacterium mucosum]KAJ55081.1 hypothetical protein ACMU_15100 [Actibacterium mucosum KCTC 23349]
MTDRAEDHRVTRLFVIVVVLYFTGQMVLRLLHGGAYELDEAELSIMTPGYAWGYGPQLPLYNWLQLSVFHLLGRSLFALALLKALLLAGIYLGLFLGLRMYAPARSAALAAVSLFLVPYMAYETQRATSHTTIMLCMSSLFLAAFFWAAKKRSWAAYATLGLTMLVGGVSKYNFWLLPVCLFLAALILPKWRHAVATPKLALPFAIIGLLWLPYGWMLNNPTLAFASVGKIAMGTHATPTWVQGLSEAALAVISMVLFPLAIWGGALAFGRQPARNATPDLARLFSWTSGLMAGGICIGVIVADAGNVSAHWMLPLSILLLVSLALWLAPRLSERGATVLVIAAVVLALIVAAGLTYDRYKYGARKDADFVSLPSQIAEVTGNAATLIVADFFVSGNLKRLLPNADIAPYLARARFQHDGQQVLLIFRKNQPSDVEQALALAGWAEVNEFDTVATGSFALPYQRGGDPLELPFVLVRLAS